MLFLLDLLDELCPKLFKSVREDHTSSDKITVRFDQGKLGQNSNFFSFFEEGRKARRKQCYIKETGLGRLSTISFHFERH